MEVPLVYFLVLYLIVIGFFIVGSSFVIYHAVRFGQASAMNKITMTIYIAVSVLLIGFSLLSVRAVDWSQRIDVLGASLFFFL